MTQNKKVSPVPYQEQILRHSKFYFAWEGEVTEEGVTLSGGTVLNSTPLHAYYSSKGGIILEVETKNLKLGGMVAPKDVSWFDGSDFTYIGSIPKEHLTEYKRTPKEKKLKIDLSHTVITRDETTSAHREPYRLTIPVDGYDFNFYLSFWGGVSQSLKFYIGNGYVAYSTTGRLPEHVIYNQYSIHWDRVEVGELYDLLVLPFVEDIQTERFKSIIAFCLEKNGVNVEPEFIGEIDPDLLYGLIETYLRSWKISTGLI